MKKAVANNLMALLYKTTGVISFSNDADIEVQPGIFSPLYINLKSPLFSHKSRIQLSKALASKIGNDANLICGIESGGSYYASCVADILKKKLIFFRKEVKKYNIKNYFVGNPPKQGETVVIVDDVISSGYTLSKVVNELKKIGCKIKAIIIFSYSLDQKISHKIGIEINSLTNVNELIEYGLRNKLMTKEISELIKNQVQKEKKRVTKLK